MLGISDASVISQEVDVTLLLLQHRRYPRNVCQRAKRVIDEVGGKLFGVILNNVNIKTDDNYYYYAGYSTSYYGYRKRTARARGKKAAATTPVLPESHDTADGAFGDPARPSAGESGHPHESPNPRITYMRPPPADSDDRF